MGSCSIPLLFGYLKYTLKCHLSPDLFPAADADKAVLWICVLLMPFIVSLGLDN